MPASRRRRTAVALAAAALSLTACGDDGGSGTAPTTAQTVDQPGNCPEPYSPYTAAATRDFAFDGTAIKTSPGRQAGFGAAVTFRVHEWFAGDLGPKVTVDMRPPGLIDPTNTDKSMPAYELDNRLLVSGEHLRGGSSDRDMAAWGCGFTRHYDKRVADAWRTGAQSR